MDDDLLFWLGNTLPYAETFTAIVGKADSKRRNLKQESNAEGLAKLAVEFQQAEANLNMLLTAQRHMFKQAVLDAARSYGAGGQREMARVLSLSKQRISQICIEAELDRVEEVTALGMLDQHAPF